MFSGSVSQLSAFKTGKAVRGIGKSATEHTTWAKFYSGKNLKGQLTPVSRQHVIEPYTEKRTCVATYNALCNERQQLQLVAF